MKSYSPIPILNDGNFTAYNDEQKTNLIADHFEKSFTPNPVINQKFNDKIETFMSSPIYAVPTAIKYISPHDVLNITQKLKINKAAGHDGISNKMLKELNITNVAKLTKIFNAMLRLSYFPQAWKFVLVRPICKAGKDPKNPTHYRPISLLSSLSKIFEKLLLTRFLNYICLIQVLPNYQFGFHSNYSTTYQLLRVTELIADSFHNKQHTIGLFLDIAQAFDKVWHVGLLFKLYDIGIPIYLFKIITNFLFDRHFVVKINSSLSSTRSIQSGIPQGSTLSPLLFNIYMSDIPYLPFTTIALYADDTALFATHNNIKIARNTLQNSIQKYLKWTQLRRILINPTKTRAKIFTHCRPTKPPSLIINNINIPWLDNNIPVKYLGLHLDQRLTWKSHIQIITNKTYHKISKLYPICNSKSKLRIDCGISIFKSIIRPSLTYACPIWCNASSTNIKKIQIIQNKFLRKILKADWFISNKQIHRELQIDSIKTPL